MSGAVPRHWQKFKMPSGTSVGIFVSSLVHRLAQLESIASGSAVGSVWLGGFFQPEAYVTATRQAVAHDKGWSLEQLVLSLDVDDITAEGYKIKGGCWSARMTGGLR